MLQGWLVLVISRYPLCNLIMCPLDLDLASVTFCCSLTRHPLTHRTQTSRGFLVTYIFSAAPLHRLGLSDVTRLQIVNVLIVNGNDGSNNNGSNNGSNDGVVLVTWCSHCLHWCLHPICRQPHTSCFVQKQKYNLDIWLFCKV